jgi:hypothetical protein
MPGEGAGAGSRMGGDGGMKARIWSEQRSAYLRGQVVRRWHVWRFSVPRPVGYPVEGATNDWDTALMLVQHYQRTWR